METWEVSWESQELHNHGETKIFHRTFQATSQEDAVEKFYQSCRREIEIVNGKKVISIEEWLDAIYIGVEQRTLK